MSIIKLAHAYKEFQNKYGHPEESNLTEIINNLFTTQFTKIANGKVLVAERSSLEQQLSGVKNYAGAWIMHETYIIPSADNTQCTIRYILNTDKNGKFDILAILSSSDGKKINSIDEIYYQIK